MACFNCIIHKHSLYFIVRIYTKYNSNINCFKMKSDMNIFNFISFNFIYIIRYKFTSML